MKLPGTVSVSSTRQTRGESVAAASGRRRFLVDKNRASSFCYKNILANRSVPILFILVCFLVIANTNCDHASSTNGVVKQKLLQSSSETADNLNTQNDQDLEQPSEQQAAVAVHIKSSTSAPTRTKLDPLNVLREIYLDGNSKVTMLMPDDLGIVQKFHPNGRYGRRSVDNFAEQHDELGKLDDELDPYRAPNSQPLSNIVADGEANSLTALLRSMGRDLDMTRGRINSNASRSSGGGGGGGNSAGLRHRQQFHEPALGSQAKQLELVNSQITNYQLEMNKLLRCNYSGVSNLYWCNSNSNAATTMDGK